MAGYDLPDYRPTWSKTNTCQAPYGSERSCSWIDDPCFNSCLGSQFIRGRPNEQLRDKLYELWKAQPGEVVTGVFQARVFEYRYDKETHITREQFHDLISRLKTVDEKSIAALRDNELLKGGRFSLWPGEMVLTVDDKSVRNDWPKLNKTRVFHQGVDISRLGGQTDLWPPDSGWHIMTLEDMRYTPYLAPKRDADQLKVLKVKVGEAEIKTTEELVLADPATGFVSWASNRKESVQKQNYIERYQFSPMKTSSGVLVPRITIQVMYSEGELFKAIISVIDKVTLNEEIPAGTFLVSLPRGITVVDHRRGEPALVVETQQPVLDVVLLANQSATKRAKVPPK